MHSNQSHVNKNIKTVDIDYNSRIRVYLLKGYSAHHILEEGEQSVHVCFNGSKSVKPRFDKAPFAQTAKMLS